MSRVTDLAVRAIAVAVPASAFALVAWASLEGSPNAVGVALFAAIVVAAVGGSLGLWVGDLRLAALGTLLLAVLAQGQAVVGPFVLAVAVLLAAGTGLCWGTEGPASTGATPE